MYDDDEISEDAALIAGAFLLGYPRQMTAAIRGVAQRYLTSLSELKRALKSEGLTIAGFTGGPPAGLDNLDVVMEKVRPVLAALGSELDLTSVVEGPITDPSQHPSILAKLLIKGDNDATDVAIALMAEFRGKSGSFDMIKRRLEDEGLAQGPGALSQGEYELKLRTILDSA